MQFMDRIARTVTGAPTTRETESVPGLVLPEFCNLPAIAIAMLIGELLVIVLVLSSASPSWQTFALTSLFVQWVVLMSAGILCALRKVLASLTLAEGALIAYGVVLATTLLVSVVCSASFTDNTGTPGVGLDWRWIGGNLVISAIITGMVLRYLYVQERLRSQEQSELQSRIQALQSRIRPHFLFNSMNIIASLIAVEPDTAETVVEDLSELFRASLNDAGNQVPLEEELGLCERYLRIEGLRLGDRLQVQWQKGELPEGLKIPLLTLQPLLENSIYHGIQPLPEGGTISVDISYANEIASIVVTNPIAPESYRDRTHKQGNRMALANIRSRLSVLYGTAAELTTNTNGDVYITELSYPYTIAGTNG